MEVDNLNSKRKELNEETRGQIVGIFRAGISEREISKVLGMPKFKRKSKSQDYQFPQDLTYKYVYHLPLYMLYLKLNINDDDGFSDSRGTKNRKRTEDGLMVYDLNELKIGDGGGKFELLKFKTNDKFSKNRLLIVFMKAAFLVEQMENSNNNSN
ncbi:6924_t:CDS:2 [Entrophospora sp. SA101]|nr:6924_t:CDS:2 [Entrophospora sp. SA101]